MIKIENLNSSFGSFNLSGINLHIPYGCSFVLLGPTGAGKSLLLECILGIRNIKSGKIILAGKDITNLQPEKREIAYLPQELYLFNHLSVKENILFGPKARRIRPDKIKGNLSMIIEALSLEDLIGRKDIKSLSRGEQQRVALARALILHPKVLLMDEPFSALDARIKRRFQLLLREIQSESELTILHVTHDQEEAFIMADRMAVILEGKVEQSGTPEDIYHNPVNLKIARFLMMENIYPIIAKKDSGGGILILDSLNISVDEIPFEGNGYFGIRPEEVVVIRPDRPLREELKTNFFNGIITRILNLGDRRMIRIVLNGTNNIAIEASLTHHTIRESKIKENTAIQIHLPPEAIWVYGGKNVVLQK